MAKTIISEGKTTSEAIEKGLKAIGLPKELVEIKVIEDNKKSFFDILAPKVVKVELKEKEAKKPEEFEIETTEDELNTAKIKVEKFIKEFVEKTGKIITLEPMQAYERKIIHSFLQENPKVETRSIGQEPRRRIVISKK